MSIAHLLDIQGLEEAYLLDIQGLEEADGSCTIVVRSRGGIGGGSSTSLLRRLSTTLKHKALQFKI